MKKITQTAGRTQLGNFAPEFAHYNDDILFSENWNNTNIDIKTRSIITVVSLISQGITDNSLKYHLQNAKNNGVTKNANVDITVNPYVTKRELSHNDYKKNKNNQWEVIYINPEKCIEDKNLNEKTHST